MPKVNHLEKKLLFQMSKALKTYKMINDGDRVMVCLSGGKDSFTLLTLLHKLAVRSHGKFDIFSFTLDQSQPGWDDSALRDWLEQRNIPYEILTRDTYSIVKEKVPEGKTYCSLCSRLRRGNIYQYAQQHKFSKIALGHHRDDINNSLLMSILYNGRISSMPPKLLSDDKQHVVIRPLVYCQEADIAEYARLREFPIIPCNLCGTQENLARQRVDSVIKHLARQNPKVPSNILRSVSNVSPSQLMDSSLWDFAGLEQETLIESNEEL